MLSVDSGRSYSPLSFYDPRQLVGGISVCDRSSLIRDCERGIFVEIDLSIEMNNSNLILLQQRLLAHY